MVVNTDTQSSPPLSSTSSSANEEEKPKEPVPCPYEIVREGHQEIVKIKRVSYEKCMSLEKTFQKANRAMGERTRYLMDNKVEPSKRKTVLNSIQSQKTRLQKELQTDLLLARVEQQEKLIQKLTDGLLKFTTAKKRPKLLDMLELPTTQDTPKEEFEEALKGYSAFDKVAYL
mmetsp:Transcript_11594/g.17555  ORF Transcript_11594/g.17555 Transcript_11594/m.17555 type:complete len:173 (-) Transcript_11594:221-739(-)